MAKTAAPAKSNQRPSTKARQTGSLEIDQDMDFQRRAWLVQRIGWVVMALIVLAALLGLFGTGPFSHTTAGAIDGPLRLEYSRFSRYKSPSMLRIHFAPGLVRENQVRLWFSQPYLEALEIEHITPEPSAVEISGDRLIYTFEVADVGQSNVVTYYAQSDKIGSVMGQIGVVDGPALTFNQLFYP